MVTKLLGNPSCNIICDLTIKSLLKLIEYLSLDTEGSEYEILREHDFNKYKFGYICIEHNKIEKNRKAIRELLESKGYIYHRENGDSYWGVIDDEYILKNINDYN